jgi:hypothetical protein
MAFYGFDHYGKAVDKPETDSQLLQERQYDWIKSRLEDSASVDISNSYYHFRRIQDVLRC